MNLDEPHYPDWLEQWWLDQVEAHLPSVDGERDLDTLADEVQDLSDLFLQEEANFSAYDGDPRLLLAYGLFYFPQTYVRAQWPLRELLTYRGWKPPLHRPMRILDLGSGLGSASLGVLDVLVQYAAIQDLPEPLEFHLTAVDHARHSLQWYSKLVHDLHDSWPGLTHHTRLDNLLRYGTLPADWEKSTTTTQTSEPRPAQRRGRQRNKPPRGQRHKGKASTSTNTPAAAPAEEPWDLIVSSFALTEVFRGHNSDVMWTWLQGLLERLSPEGILLILEPASQDSCERLEDLRDQAARDEAYGIWGPCLHHQDCPLRQDGRAWCHEVRSWDVPSSLEYVNRRLYRAMQAVKFGYLALGHQRPQTLSSEAPTMRLIAPMSRQKGHWITRGCTTEGENVSLEIFTRDLRGYQTSEVEGFTRGDIVSASQWEPRKRPQAFRLPPGESLTTHHPEPHELQLDSHDE
ncbi:MAG: hypothetical protein EP343_18180 [Deltaproteobacteria bacterium]|nr:MAG: hypothetical protein EP343_18180 [Deltaproteobacteria bacterium]